MIPELAHQRFAINSLALPRSHQHWGLRLLALAACVNILGLEVKLLAIIQVPEQHVLVSGKPEY